MSSSTRQVVRRTPPRAARGLDAQFWPVCAALVLTAALALVAALATMRGTALWFSLFLVPVALLLSLVVVGRVGNRWLRRSLQLAATGSVALHLLLLIIAALTQVFGAASPFQPEKQVVNRPSRVILTSRARAEPVWEQLNERSVEEPQVESERAPTTLETETSPVQIENLEQRHESQVSRRSEQRQSDAPRLAESLSQRRRSESGATPSSAATAAVAPPSAAPSQRNVEASDAAAAPSRETPADSPAAPRQSVSAALPAATQAARATRETSPSRPVEQRTQPPARTAASVRNPSPQPVRSAAPPSAAAARTSGRSRTSPATQPATPAAGETGGRAIASDSPAQPTTLTAEQPARQPSRNRTPRAEPVPDASIALNEAPVSPSPARNSANRAPDATVRPAELPSQSGRVARQAGAQPQPSATSLTRAETSGALASTSSAFSSLAVPTAGAAPTASDSQRRTEPSSVAAPLELMSSQTPSRSRDVTATAPSSSSAWEANTSDAALLAGQRTTDARSQTSPQAQSAASSRDPRMELAAQPGESSVDSQPVKRPNETTRRESGGGGSPAIDALQAGESGQRRARSASQTARMDAEAADIPAAERTTDAASSDGGGQPQALDTGESHIASESTDPAAGLLGSADAGQPAGDAIEAARRSDDGRDGESPELAQAVSEDDSRSGAADRGANRSQAPSVAADASFGDASNRATADAAETGPAEAQVAESGARSSSQAVAEMSSGVALGGDSGPTPSRTGDATRRTESASSGEGNSQLASDSTGARSTRRRAAGSAPEAELVDPRSGNSSATGPVSDATPSAASTSERVGQSMELDIRAETGAAGLGDQPSDELGTPLRPGERDSKSIQFDLQSRFVRDNPSSLPGTSAEAAIAREAFSSRQPSPSGSQPVTEASIELGLEFLARHQQPDGSWSLEAFDVDHPLHGQQLISNTAATGLAVLAFQGAGYHHRDFRYAQQLERALRWLVDHQAEDGNLYVESDARSNSSARLYSHAIAALALTEAWGMTQDPALREPCERAVGFIVETQDPNRGGWRYFTEPARRSSDTSVTGWMLMALQSARLGGLEVPPECFGKIDDWMAVAHDPANESLYRYDPYAEDDTNYRRAQQRQATAPMTAVGLLMRIYRLGDRTGEEIATGANWLMQTPPGQGDSMQRDTYYWYYATQVLKHAGGREWPEWHAQLHPLLVNSQVKTGPLAGSWDPYAPVPDRWGPFGGRLYVTTMNLLSLEVDYRLLPLYREQAETGER